VTLQFGPVWSVRLLNGLVWRLREGNALYTSDCHKNVLVHVMHVAKTKIQINQLDIHHNCQYFSECPFL
jgi:hypothetical protein